MSNSPLRLRLVHLRSFSTAYDGAGSLHLIVSTPRNGDWSAVQVKRVLDRTSANNGETRCNSVSQLQRSIDSEGKLDQCNESSHMAYIRSHVYDASTYKIASGPQKSKF